MTVIFQTYDEIIGRIQEPIRDTSKIFVVNVNTYSNYKLIFDTFTESKKIRLSDFTDGDNYPSKSECYEKIKGTDNTTLVCGFSQYMVLLPEKDQQRIFSDILQISLSSKLPHAVVFLFYRQESLLLNKLKGDLRLNENILLLNDKPSDKLSLITFVPPNLRFGDSEIILSGYKKYLYKSEDNPATSWTVRTDFALSPFPGRSCLIECILSAYAYLSEKKFLSKLILETGGNQEDWEDLLIKSDNKSIPIYLSERFKSKRLDELFWNFGESSNNQERWYIWLQMKQIVLSAEISDKTDQSYLSHVVSASDSVENFLNRYFCDLLAILPDDPKYSSWYMERRNGLKRILNSHLKQFSLLEEKIRHMGEKRVYYLTDTTENEKRLLLEWVCEKSHLDSETLAILNTEYPDLASYLKKYTFAPNISNAKLYTDYFQKYKIQKVTNNLQPEFCKWVNELADVNSRPYYNLPSRAEILDKYTSETSCVYYFIDCLGAEYLGFILDYCKKNKLYCQIHIASANVPTETEYNTEFKDELHPLCRYDIDKIKHKGIESTSINQNDIPYYIVSELETLRKYLGEILSLSQQNQKVIIISDHGSSRSCVLNYRKDNDVTTKVKAELVKTRYCICSQDSIKDPALLIYKDYSIWANYNRFSVQGGPQWEIHGGASIEERVIPLIEISCHKGNYTVTCQKDIIRPKPLEKPVLMFYITPSADGVTLEIGDATFDCESTNNSDWLCKFPENFKAGKYVAKVIINSNEIGKFDFTIEKGMKKMSLLGGRL